MKQIKLLFSALLLLCATMANAYNFEVGGIFYNITDEAAKTVEVTYEYSINSDTYNGSVTIPATVTYNSVVYDVTGIGEYAFYYNTGLTSVQIPGSVTAIGESAFDGCASLAGIDLPSGLKSIGDCAFQHCKCITEVVLPEGLTSIGGYAFYNCADIVEVKIPASVTSIGRIIFGGGTKLAKISVAAGNTVYDSREGCNAVVETETNTIVLGCKNTVIPASIVCIGECSFYGCTGLTEIAIPSGVKSIGQLAFYHCIGLTDVVIPEGVEEIAYRSFADCSSLESVTIPASVEYLSGGEFEYCDALKSITLKNETPLSLNSSPFSTHTAALYVPFGAKTAYEAAEIWNNFTNIVEDTEYTLTVTSARHATLYLSKPVSIPSGVEVYYAKSIDGELLNMEQITGYIPANTGVIVRANKGEYTFAGTDANVAPISGNLLKGTSVDTKVSASSYDKVYVLSKVDGDVGMFLAKTDYQGMFLNNGNRAYMPLSSRLGVYEDEFDTSVPGGQLGAGYRFNFDGATAINAVAAENGGVEAVYDLQGRVVENPANGLYIINGKKVLVK